MKGGQVIMLRPDGHLDMELFSKTIRLRHVTNLGIVPSQMVNLVMFLNSTNRENALETLRCVTIGGTEKSQHESS